MEAKQKTKRCFMDTTCVEEQPGFWTWVTAPRNGLQGYSARWLYCQASKSLSVQNPPAFHTPNGYFKTLELAVAYTWGYYLGFRDGFAESNRRASE